MKSSGRSVGIVRLRPKGHGTVRSFMDVTKVTMNFMISFVESRIRLDFISTAKSIRRSVMFEIRHNHNSSLQCLSYNARFNAHQNNPVVSLVAQTNNRRLRRHLPNDLPTRFIA
jgi:hypothetical protein